MNVFIRVGDTYINTADIRYFKAADGSTPKEPATYFKLKSGDFLIVNGISAEQVSKLLREVTYVS